MEEGIPPGASNMQPEKSALDKLNEQLYSPRANISFVPPSLSPRAPVSNWKPGDVATHAQADATWNPVAPPAPRKQMSWTVIFLIAALAFFIIAGGISFIFLFHGGRSVSSDNLIITVQGPTSIASGTAVPLVITVQNRNPEAIESTDISLDFPDGTRSADDVTQPLIRYTDTLGSIQPGASVNRTVQAVLFGGTNQTVTIPITVNYHTADSNELFTKKQNYTFTITSSPLSITTKAIASTASGQPFTISVAVRSNATTPLDNIAVAAQYPPGFLPSSEAGKKAPGPFFSLGTIEPGQEQDFSVMGTLSGSNNDVKDFQFTVGTMKTDGSQTLAVPYASQQTEVAISKPFLAATISVNNSPTDPTVVNAGQQITSLVTWVDTLASAITNGQVAVAISGSAFDPNSATAANGYYDSAHNSVLFDSRTEQSLAQLQPGDTGKGTFTFSTKSGAALTALRNPTIVLSVSVAGQPANTQTPIVINNTLTRTIQIATDLELQSNVVRTVGPFSNSGSWPPVPNQPTTYTVRLNVTNTVNSVGGGTVSMILPPYVTFTGKETPNDGSLAYDADKHTVTWKIGDVPAGTGFGAPALTAAFQISFTPSISQKDTTPVLVENQSITGQDRFTNTQVGMVESALTTETTADPAYRPQFGIVGN